MAPQINTRLGGLHNAISDVYYTSHGGLFRPNYLDLQQSLLELSLDEGNLLPETYQNNVLHPFIRFLERLGKNEFERFFCGDEGLLTTSERSLKSTIEEVAEALLQRNHHGKYYRSSFDDLLAFQAIVTTIYDDILNSTISELAQNTIAPLAKWGHSKGPYTLPIKLTEKVGVAAGTEVLLLKKKRAYLATIIRMFL